MLEKAKDLIIKFIKNYSFLLITIATVLTAVIVLFLFAIQNKDSIESNNKGSVESDFTVNKTKPDRQLDTFLPDKPFSYSVTGSTPYEHIIKLEAVYQTANAKTYKFIGSVADLTKGKSGGDYSLNLNLTVTPDSIVQEKQSKYLQDSDFDKITLLKSPVKVGTTWEERLERSDGSQAGIVAKVTSVEKGTNGDSVTVEYKEEDSDYYEKRILRQGVGVVYFEKLLRVSDESVVFSYSAKDVNERPMEEFVYESKYEVDANGNLVEIRGMGSEFYAKKAPLIEAAIINYDKAWEKYVNNKNREIFQMLVPASPALNGVKGFVNDGYSQLFEEMQIKCISFSSDDRACAVVYEKIKKARGDDSRQVEYYLKYKLRNIKGEWKIESYSPCEAGSSCD